MDTSYSLVWEDSFETTGRPDQSKWSYDIGHGKRGWGNEESQFYTNKDENCRVEDGRLIITAIQNVDTSCTSARIHSYGKASWKYGRFEIRAKLPGGKGTWPAIWMLSDGIREGVPWPLCGEIDIMEHVGRDPEKIHFSLHTADYNHRKDTQITSTKKISGILEGFHTYRMDWDEEGFQYFVDDEPMCTFCKEGKTRIEEWPFDQPFHLILNLAIGGHWGGEVDDAVFPAVMEVEFVRVYKKIQG